MYCSVLGVAQDQCKSTMLLAMQYHTIPCNTSQYHNFHVMDTIFPSIVESAVHGLSLYPNKFLLIQKLSKHNTHFFLYARVYWCKSGPHNIIKNGATPCNMTRRHTLTPNTVIFCVCTIGIFVIFFSSPVNKAVKNLVRSNCCKWIDTGMLVSFNHATLQLRVEEIQISKRKI